MDAERAAKEKLAKEKEGVATELAALQEKFKARAHITHTTHTQHTHNTHL